MAGGGGGFNNETQQNILVLDNDQLDTHLFYFTVRELKYSTCLEHYMLIIRCTGRPLTDSDDTRCCINTIHPPHDEHIMFQT